MGLEACEAIAQFLVKHTATKTVVDPFCGVGTMLAVANQHGLDAIGVELSAKRAEKARALELRPRASGDSVKQSASR
jgi:DNA modification methylase